MFLLALAAAAAVQSPAPTPPAARPAGPSAPAAAAGSPVQLPPPPALTEQIMRADAALFGLFFTGTCDVPRLRAMIADGAEFYHDRRGLASTEQFVAAYTEDCERRARPDAPRVRRELVEGSVTITPIAGQGAFETGEHLFYESRPGSEGERLAGRRRFALLWLLGTDGRWRLSRVFDYRVPRME